MSVCACGRGLIAELQDGGVKLLNEVMVHSRKLPLFADMRNSVAVCESRLDDGKITKVMGELDIY